MAQIIHNIIKINIFNLITILSLAIGYVFITIPAANYFMAGVSLFSVSVPWGVAGLNAVVNIILFISSLPRVKVQNIFAIAFSLALLLFGWAVYYPWARYTVHFPTTANVCWRENALFLVRDDLAGFIRKNHGTMPTNNNWKELLVEKGYDFNNMLETWEKSFDSSVVINENIKGMELEKIDKPLVFLFEGPKGHSFGNEETFKQFADENKYVYVVLTNGDSGRIRLKDGKAESLFGGLDNQDLPLIWK